MAIVKDLGMVTAYAYAVAGGYEGTEAEFEQMLGRAGITLEQLENLTAVATTLSEGSEATASYSDGVLTFGIPRGNTGATGPQGPQGVQGETGNGIASITKTGTSGLVDTYTITFTDGTTTTFTVTNGADGDITNVAAAFDATKAYAVGDMVLYRGTLYAFTAAHPAGAWVGSDAQAVILADEVTELKDDLSLVVGEKETIVDLTFDIVGYYYNGNLSNLHTDIADSRSTIISVEQGDIYKVSGQSQYNQKLACVYDVNDNILLTIMPENSGQIITDYEFTIPENGVKMSLSFLHNYPSYAVTLKKIETELKPIEAESLDIFDANIPVNLYDYASATDGAYMNPDGTTSTRSDMCYAYVPITPGVHVVNVTYNFFGNTANRIPYFDTNKQYISYLSGTKLTDGGTNLEVVSIDVPANAKYICLSNRVVYKNRVMAVKASTMPGKYSVYFTPYNALENEEKVNAENVKGADSNPLYLKTVAFDGDSICHGVSAADGKSGWAGRIGNANEMNWKNYGVSGGTITNNHSHCILNTLNDIHNYMPTLDYYIFEGGTNDADHLGLSGIGTVTDNDYTGSYDTDTFSGAFETLIYNALTFYPTTKIGYIVAQKMGKTNNANYAVRKAFFDRAIEICKKWGVPYVNLWYGSHLNPNLDSMYDASMTAEENIAAGKMYIDGQHLTPTGYDYITPIIEAWMKTL